MTRRALHLVLLFSVALLIGCASDQKKVHATNPLDAAPVAKPLPPINDVIAAYNARAASIPRLWASTVTIVEFQERVGDQVRDRSEQFEGYFQFVAPRRVALTFDKLGDTYAALGSDESRFWWLQRGDDPRGYVGTREHAGMTGLRSLGVPISPDDLTRLLGLQPLDVSPTGGGPYRLTWTRDAQWLVLLRDRGGEAGEERLAIDPDTYEPVKIELVLPGDAGRGPQRFSADLRKYAPVEVRGVALPNVSKAPRVPERAELSLWNESTRVQISLFSAEISPQKPNKRVFDLAWLTKQLGLQASQLEDLDAMARAPAARNDQPPANPAPRARLPENDLQWR